MDSATRVLLVRHGETAWNVDSRIQGQLDVGLNERGRWQAVRLAQAVADEPLDAIYASPLSRAFATAEAVAGGRGLAVVPDPALMERHFGDFQGMTFVEIEQRWPDLALRWRQRDPDFGPAGGETLAAFYGRSVAAVGAIAARHRGQSIAVVAHGGVLDCLYRAAARLDLQATRTWRLGNASINRLLHSDEGFSLVGWDDERHLAEAPRDEIDDRVGPAA
ncbi:histidine phosphatase family protein [Aquabacterium sp. J223]|uniref:histidine phosphatase family protein n=1 Tax=Aquabacterium sp. J223 TaxID=2898431 RepID=UPI0021AE1415|nr:histidine phosphatase family protein [Aquabacterium sp. J223]UUX95985.1 histidine phosphatase family protein [Aquabacterium sp. J223]